MAFEGASFCVEIRVVAASGRPRRPVASPMLNCIYDCHSQGRHRVYTAHFVRERSMHAGFDVLEQHLHSLTATVSECEAFRLLQGTKMGPGKSLMLLCLTAAAFSSSWAAAPSADDLISTSCGVALDVFSQCSSAAKGGKLDTACCTPYSVLKTFGCFWYVQISPVEPGGAKHNLLGPTHCIAVAYAQPLQQHKDMLKST